MLKIFFESLINLIKFINLYKKKKEFVFFSESKFYRNYFIDLILNLKKLGQKNIILITSDKDDVTFFKDTLTCLYIKNYFILSIFFKMLNCKFMIMTLTDLGNHFQKSKLCKFYVYFFHAIASTHKVYTHSAFKNYDIIFANGNYQVDELRFAEKEFGFKKLVETAIKHGIRVIGIDTVISTKMGIRSQDLGAGGDERIKGMNYQAYTIIKQTSKEDKKWVSLMGNAHISSFKNTLGCKMLLN